MPKTTARTIASQKRTDDGNTKRPRTEPRYIDIADDIEDYLADADTVARFRLSSTRFRS